MKEKKYPNFQDLYSFEDYKKTYEARSTFSCGLSPVCLQAPLQHNSGSSNLGNYTKFEFRTLRLEYAIQVWLKAALISQRHESQIRDYWNLRYTDNDTSFREVKYYEKYTIEKQRTLIDGFWKLLEEIADSGEIKVCEGFAYMNKTNEYESYPQTDFIIILDMEEMNTCGQHIDDIFTYDYNTDKKSYSWKEIKDLFTELNLKQLSLTDLHKLYKRKNVDETLFCACEALDLEGVKNAVRMGANVNALNEFGNSAIEHTIGFFGEALPHRKDGHTDEERKIIEVETFRKCTDIIDYLLEQGADIDLYGVDGQQPLVTAYYQTHSIEIIKYLLENGSNPNYNSYRSDDLDWDEDQCQCTVLQIIDELLYDEYDEFEEEMEKLIHDYGGRRYAWDYDPQRRIHIGKYYISISANRGKWMFYDNGWAIGNSKEISIEDKEGNKTKFTIPADYSEELEEWQKDYQDNIDGDEFNWNDWNKRGKALAEKIAKVLPSTVALHYPFGCIIKRMPRPLDKGYYLECLDNFIRLS